MTKPRLIIIIRHAQSEGNKNREIHQTTPDHRVKLTKLGWEQAYDAGHRLRAMLRPDDTLHFFTSPYRRTRETTEAILSTLTADNGEPSPFKRNNIKVYEEPRLREQDFGNFQPCSVEMERMWQERADYGHFFYRIPNGESAADAYDRVSGFNESLWRQFGEDDFASVCVLVTHGLMSRVFLMKWYHFTVEYFEDLRNINHCEFLIMRKDEQSGKYALESKLRTWSELRRERASANREKDEKETEPRKDVFKLQRTKTFVATRRWGGCPNGCNHGSHYKTRDDLETLRDKDMSGGENGSGSGGSTNGNGTAHHSSSGTSSTIISRRPAAKRFQSFGSEDGSDDPDQHCEHCGHHHGDGHAHEHDHVHVEGHTHITVSGPQIDVDRAREDPVSSPDPTPHSMSAEGRMQGLMSPQYLHLGRDFGGTYSGHASLAGSDAEQSDDDQAAAKTATNGNGAAKKPVDIPKERRQLGDGGMYRGARANRLGDAPHSSSDASDGDHDGDHDGEGEGEDEDLCNAEKEEKSVEGSIY